MVGIVIFGVGTALGLVAITRRRRMIDELGYDPGPGGRSIAQVRAATLLAAILFVGSLLLRLSIGP
jgi:hypothetical protein